MGMNMSGITGQDVKDKNTGKHLQMMKQIMKTISAKSINIKDVPEIFRLLKEGEEVHDLKKLSADELLVRWINYHLGKLGKDEERVTNLGKDIKNSRALIYVMTRLDSSLNTDALAIEDEVERAQKMIDNSKQMGVPHILDGKDFTLANIDLNRIFVSLLFNTKHGLEELNEEEIKKAQMIDDDIEGAADERAFRLWMNSLNIEDLYITDLYEDVSDGLALLRIIDKLKPGTVNWKKVEMKPKNVFAKGSNCNLVVEHLKDLNIKLVGTQGSHIKNKEAKHIAALVWQLVRFHYLHLIGDKTEDFLIQWANKMTDGKHDPIKDFKDK
jgi:plastin-1